MRVRLEPELSVKGKPPREALAFRFQHQIIVLLHRSCKIPAKRNLHAGQIVLGRMINVRSHNRHCLAVLIHVHFAVQAIGIPDPVKIRVVRDELILPKVRLYDFPLPHQEVRGYFPLELIEFCAEAPVDRTAHVRKILPDIHAVAPVIESERMVHRIQIIVKLLTQILYKGALHIRSRRIVGLGLIVQLNTDDIVIGDTGFHHLPDHPLRIIQIDRMRNVHDLTGAIDPAPPVRRRKHVRIGLLHPRRNCVGRCP